MVNLSCIVTFWVFVLLKSLSDYLTSSPSTHAVAVRIHNDFFSVSKSRIPDEKENSPALAVWKLVVNTPWLLWLFTDHWAPLSLVRCHNTGLWLVNELGQVKIHFWLCPGSGATGLPVATTWGPRPAEIRHMVKTTSTLITYHSVAKVHSQHIGSLYIYKYT